MDGMDLIFLFGSFILQDAWHVGQDLQDTSHGHSWLSCFGTYTYTTIQEERGACDRSV
jgi:hypothetical protein